MRETFERELRQLEDELLDLGSRVEEALLESVEALRQRDLETSARLVAQDDVLNERRFTIESAALILIATQQPMAGDLRTIAAVLEIATELERIGDYAKGIARIALMIADEPLVKPLIDIPIMARKAAHMLHEALDAFVRRDVVLARTIPKEDAEVDHLYDQVYRDLLGHIVADPQTIDRATHLLWVAHNLERAADRVTNICERVVFTVTGEMVELDEGEGVTDLAG
jgi:phosphate transport system protein